MAVRLALVAAATAVGLLAAVPAAPAADRLPNLRMAQLRDFRVQFEGGRKLLRYTATIVNVGAGSFELRGVRSSSATPEMTVTQRIYGDSPAYRDVATTAVMFYAGDGHNHWHVRDLETSELVPMGATAPVRYGAKHGFCFVDSGRFNGSLTGAPLVPRYLSCGSSLDTAVTMGLSIGWSDIYPWSVAFQYVDITGLESGTYRLTATANNGLGFTESDTSDNFTWVDLSLAGNLALPIGYGPFPKPNLAPPAPQPIPLPFPWPWPR